MIREWLIPVSSLARFWNYSDDKICEEPAEALSFFAFPSKSSSQKAGELFQWQMKCRIPARKADIFLKDSLIIKVSDTASW